MIGKVNHIIRIRPFLNVTFRPLSAFTNTIIDSIGDPFYTWVIALIYLWFLFNHIHPTVINCIPITKSTGSTTDIIPLLRFRFWQPVYNKVGDSYLS